MMVISLIHLISITQTKYLFPISLSEAASFEEPTLLFVPKLLEIDRFYRIQMLFSQKMKQNLD